MKQLLILHSETHIHGFIEEFYNKEKGEFANYLSAQIMRHYNVYIGSLEIYQELRECHNKEDGDFGWPCFKLAKIVNAAPNKVAEKIVSPIS